MKNRREFKDRCPENRKDNNPNGRSSSLTKGAVPAFSVMNGA